MIVEYIRYEMKTHSAEELVTAYGKAAEHLRAAPECLAFDLTRCVEEPNSLILRIHWTSVEAHMQGFRKGANFPPFFAAIKPFVGEIAEMRHYEETDLRWQR
jgi:quinol monooxygenase YgiN